MSDGNGALPEGWTYATLGDVTVKKVEQVKRDGPLTYIDISAVNNRTKRIDEPNELGKEENIPSRARQLVAASDVLVSMTRPNLNAVAKVPKDLDGAIGSTGFDVLRSIEVEPDWLFNAVKSRYFVEKMSNIVQGALYPAVRPSDIRNFKLPIPPLPEQGRIVSAIESLQTRSSRARAALSEVGPLVSQLRQSVLRAAFSGRLTAAWREQNPDVEPAYKLLARIRTERRNRWEQSEQAKYEAKGKQPPKNWKDKYKEPEPVDETKLPELPDRWCWASVGELTLIDSGEAFKKKDYTESGFRLFQIANVSFGKTLWKQQNFLPEQFGESHKHLLLDTTDIIIALNRPILNDQLKVTRVKEADLPAILYQRVGRLRTVIPEITDYLFGFMLGPMMLRQVEDNLQGSDQPYINTSDIPKIAIPLAPLAEQAEIIRIANETVEIIESQLAGLASMESSLTQLDQSILAKAFRGELVPQDPNDEPGSELLARIRAAREQLETEKKAAKKKTKAPRRNAKAAK